MVRLRSTTARASALAGLLHGAALVTSACDHDEQPSSSAEPSGPSATKTTTTATAEPWRFRPTLDQYLPEGAVAEPVLELSEPRQRTVLVLAAVLRGGQEQVRIERWTYEQIPDQEDGLRVVDEGEVVLQLQPGPPHPELAELRRRVAAPGTVLTRPVGLEVRGPDKLIERLAAELAIVRNPSAEPRARARAAATVFRALDDTVAMRGNGIAELATVLVPAPARTAVSKDSERRATVTFEAAEQTVTLGLQRKADGWAIVSAEIPPAEPAPTTAVPEPPVEPPLAP